MCCIVLHLTYTISYSSVITYTCMYIYVCVRVCMKTYIDIYTHISMCIFIIIIIIYIYIYIYILYIYILFFPAGGQGPRLLQVLGRRAGLGATSDNYMFSGSVSPLKWVDPQGSQVSSRARRSRVLALLPAKM